LEWRNDGMEKVERVNNGEMEWRNGMEKWNGRMSE
jgi:hypothetical protein